jgi:hypothetical protein
VEPVSTLPAGGRRVKERTAGTTLEERPPGPLRGEGTREREEPERTFLPVRGGGTMGIIAWIVFGFVVGLIARAVVPGTGPRRRTV